MKVFISSTCYDLIDLRAELAEELRDMVSSLTPAPRRLDLGQAIGIAREAVAGQRIPATVIVVSDFQASAPELNDRRKTVPDDHARHALHYMGSRA